MKCPVCRATYLSGQAVQSCRRCGADLTDLIQIHDRALWHYRQAIASLKVADYLQAQVQVQHAIALNCRNADFHALAGQISALQGQWLSAIAAWKQAQRFDPAHPIGAQNLTLLTALIQLG